MMKAASKEVKKVVKTEGIQRLLHQVRRQARTIKVNGVTTVDEEFPKMPDEGIIAFQLHAGFNSMEVTFKDIKFKDLSNKELPPPRDNAFMPLFNGKNLTGWKTHPDQPGGWTVEGGNLVGRSRSAQVHHLFSERGDYENFDLRVEARLNRNGNSGVFFRSEYGVSRGQRFPIGYEAQILHSYPKPNVNLTGSLVGFVTVVNPLVKPNDWFTMEVRANDNWIVIQVNGKVTADYQDQKTTYRKGRLALQAMSDAQAPLTVIEFRKIEIKELPRTKKE